MILKAQAVVIIATSRPIKINNHSTLRTRLMLYRPHLTLFISPGGSSLSSPFNHITSGSTTAGCGRF